MSDPDRVVQVTLQIRESMLLGDDPEAVRKMLGEGAYRTALRKLDPPSEDDAIAPVEGPS